MGEATNPEDVNPSGGTRGHSAQGQGNGGSLRSPIQTKAEDRRPTPDQLYLAEMIDRRWDTTEITIAGIQRLNTRYGVVLVTGAMRSLHGFPPPGELLHPYPYLETICKRTEEETA
jgi:hypothetical protein